jgi:hypothetical protein
MSEIIGHYKFAVDQPLWRLWEFLEKHNVEDIFIEDKEPSQYPDYAEVIIRRRGRSIEALIKLPKDYLEAYYLMNIIRFFGSMYYDFHGYIDDFIDGYAEDIAMNINKLHKKIFSTSLEVENLRREIFRSIKNCICYHPNYLPQKMPLFHFFNYSLEALYRTYYKMYEKRYV